MFDLVPFRRNSELSKRNDVFNQFFNHFFDDDFLSPINFKGSTFRVDLKEKDDAYIVEADLPGIKKENIKIDLKDDYLTISATRQEEKEDNQENFIRRERVYGQLQRSFYINNIEKDKIFAEFKDGILRISLPKKTKGISNYTIDIH